LLNRINIKRKICIMKISTNKYDSKPILTKDTINELQTSVKTYVENAISSLK